MRAREDRLRELFAQNDRRRNASELRRKVKELGVLAEPCGEEAVQELQWVDVFRPREKLYPTKWDEVSPRLAHLLASETAPVQLAPYNFQEFGFVRINPTALADALTREPFHFDSDGFWVVGSFGAICVDFDEAEPGSDALWLHYKDETAQSHA